VMVAENFLGGFISGVAKIASGIGRYAPQIIRGLGVGLEVVNTVSDMMNGSQKRTRSTGEDEDYPRQDVQTLALVPHQPQPKRVVEIKANSGKELAVIPNSNHRQIVTVTQVGPSRNNHPSGVNKNTGVVLRKGEKARRRQNQAIRNAVQGNAGNRWVGGKSAKQ
jgi:hypothetical protein